MGWSATGERHARLSIPLPAGKYKTDEEIFTYYIPQNIKDKGYFEVKDFDNKTPYYSSEHNGQPEQHAFYFSPLLESGYYYQFLAVGRDDKTSPRKTDCSNSLHSRKT